MGPRLVEALHAALAAEEVIGRTGAEAVAGQSLDSGGQAKAFMGHEQVAKAGLCADRAIAVEHLHALGNLGLEPNGLAMTAPGDFHAPPMDHCFDPVIRDDTRLLVLGSLPGAVSLARRQYYANPRNQFWRLMGEVVGRDLHSLPYEERLEALLDAGIGLWDTVAAATRKGSLDADIRLHSASDLGALATMLPQLQAIAFNGGTSARIGRRQMGPANDLDLIDLPSSSPAYTIKFETKLKAWLPLRDYLRQ
jgi:hypoxanthine-DNA glycosylase